jgi:hypothetical protein
MRINVAVPEANVTAPVLNAALESVTRLNEEMLEKGTVPTFAEAVKGGGIKWKPEPPGEECFDHALKVLRRGWGDCDDLAPWHAASLRATGKDPGAQAIAKRSGPKRWHAVVRRSDGSIDDPSKTAGMGQPSSVVGAVLPMMYGQQQVVGGSVGAYIVKPEIAIRPVRGAYQARADLPWYWREHLWDKSTPTDMAMTSLHSAPTASTALTGAIDGVCDLAHANGVDFARPSDVHRLAAVADCAAGVPIGELRQIYGRETADHAAHVVGSFWSSLKKIASPVANLARGAIKFVPGIGPVADTALSTAENLYNKAKGVQAQAQSIISPGGGPPRPGGAVRLQCTYF